MITLYPVKPVHLCGWEPYSPNRLEAERIRATNLRSGRIRMSLAANVCPGKRPPEGPISRKLIQDGLDDLFDAFDGRDVVAAPSPVVSGIERSQIGQEARPTA